jgi:hypothetical protein
LPTLTSATGVGIAIPISITDVTGQGIISFDLTFTYDTAVLTPVFTMGTEVSASPGTVTPGASITVNQIVPGTIKVSIFRTGPFTGSGTVVLINMNVVGVTGTDTDLEFTEVLYNGGTVCESHADGNLAVIGSITGNVAYALAATPAPVPDVLLDAPGSVNVSDTTDMDGNYSLTGFGAGPYTVTPSKPTQLCSTTNGINSNDAGLVSKHVVGLVTLSTAQLAAAKVSGNLTTILSSYDAALISQKVVDLCSVGNLAGQWRFTPPSVPHPGGVSSDLIENYTA